ncbi:MAG: TonB-dependent siderophore receptor, partial [Thermoanaerobaculia bacterium]|nr:TonB-dependent siderophore receptor [Thermoanaerobaculia bacterium]
LTLALLVTLGGQGAPLRADEETTDADGEPLPVEREFLLVEESLPHLPSSNTIATKLPVAQEKTPANVGVVSSTLIEEQGGRVLGDALTNVSGVNVHTFNGVFDLFLVRGFDSISSGLVLTDGAPEPEATFYQLYNTERVEVLKGPGGFLYGSNPLAAAVNIVREQPVPVSFGVVGLSAGSFDTFEGHFDLNRASRDGELAFRINGLWRESDGYRDRIDSEVTAFNPAMTWSSADGRSLNLNLELASSDYRPDAGLPIFLGETPDVPRSRSYGSPFDDSQQDVGRLQGDFETPLGDNLRLRNKLYYRDLDWQTSGTLLGFVIPGFAGLEVTRSLLVLDDHQTFAGNQLELLWNGTTGGVSHTLVAGLEVARFDDEFRLDVAVLPSINLFDPVETAAPPLFFLPGQTQAGDTRSEVIAPYLVDQIAFNEKLQLMVGLRWDEIDFEDPVQGKSLDHGEASPMLGLVYAATPRLSLYANAGRSFAPPSPRVTVPQSEPEESRQLEAGLRRTLQNGRGRLTLAVYELERDNIAIPDDNGFTQQVGDQRSRGVELELVGELPGGVRSTLAYSYNDAELTRFAESVLVGFFPPTFATVDRSGNTAAFAPEHLLNVWLSRRFGSRFHLGLGGRFVDEQFIAEDNATVIDSYVTLDASISYLLRDWRLTLNLKNLADEEYDTRGFGGSSVIPAAPFTAFLSFEYRL